MTRGSLDRDSPGGWPALETTITPRFGVGVSIATTFLFFFLLAQVCGTRARAWGPLVPPVAPRDARLGVESLDTCWPHGPEDG